nr:ribonuclease H-like domain-containing protein [Tanacetum cinerariifolium]
MHCLSLIAGFPPLFFTTGQDGAGDVCRSDGGCVLAGMVSGGGGKRQENEELHSLPVGTTYSTIRNYYSTSRNYIPASRNYYSASRNYMPASRNYYSTGKNKIGFIDGSCRRSNNDEVLGKQWDRVNALVFVWNLNSISEELYVRQIFSKRAKHVWKELKETYDVVDGSITFGLHHKIHTLRQNGSSIVDYYHRLNALLKQFDAMIELPRCTCHAADEFKKHNQLMKLIKFLMGLDDSYMQIRGSILSREVLPDVRSAYATIYSEESHRVVSCSIIPNDEERVNPSLNSDQMSQSDSSHSSMPGGDVNTSDFLNDNFENDAQSSDDIFAAQDEQVTTLEDNINSEGNIENPRSKWIFKIKYKSSGEIDRYKASDAMQFEEPRVANHDDDGTDLNELRRENAEFHRDNDDLRRQVELLAQRMDESVYMRRYDDDDVIVTNDNPFAGRQNHSPVRPSLWWEQGFKEVLNMFDPLTFAEVQQRASHAKKQLARRSTGSFRQLANSTSGTSSLTQPARETSAPPIPQPASAPDFIIKFLKMIQVWLKVPVRRIRTDNGTKFVNQTLREYYEEVGISHETSLARSPQQNGVVERRNLTLIKAARTMLIYAQAPLFLWAEAVATACYTQNRSIIQLRHGKTPYELLHNKLPDLSFLHMFGALCYPTNDSENLGKLQPKADIWIFIGYAPTKKAFRIYNRRIRRIVETIHVEFDELIAMVSEYSSSGPVLNDVTPQNWVAAEYGFGACYFIDQ